MKVSAVYINTYRRDYPFARICIASIRYWYPELPIYLIKDMGAGDFSTADAEKHFQVRVLDTGGKTFGWGFGKFEPLFTEGGEHFLFMDADTVMTGPVIDAVASINADFIVDDEQQPIQKLTNLYYHPDKIRDVYPSFSYPGYTFNTGQWFATSGILQRQDFQELVSWSPQPILRYPEIFRQADQGVFNFILHQREAAGKLTVQRIPLMIWPEAGAADHISLSSIRERKDALPGIIHWAGMKRDKMEHFPRTDILDFYEDYFYARVGQAQRIRDRLSIAQDKVTDMAKRISRRITGASARK
jgi:Nucleotide-diphospho-sugar transferase